MQTHPDHPPAVSTASVKNFLRVSGASGVSGYEILAIAWEDARMNPHRKTSPLATRREAAVPQFLPLSRALSLQSKSHHIPLNPSFQFHPVLLVHATPGPRISTLTFTFHSRIS
jgi:hypothetical protein